MEKRFLSPVETVTAIINSSVKKSQLSLWNLLTLGIMAGIYIGFGGFRYTVVSQTLGSIDIGLMKLLGAAVFPVGLMLIVFSGSELFTGDTLMTLALMDRRINFSKMLRTWIFVYIGNFIGSIFLAYLIAKAELISPAMSSLIFNIGNGKLSMSFQTAFLRGLLCNILVVLSVWVASAAQDIVSKIFAIWFPIMLFVLSEFEHSVANMFFLPLAKFAGSGISWAYIGC